MGRNKANRVNRNRFQNGDKMTADERNSKLYDEVIDAIDALFGDTGVDKECTRSNLRELISGLQIRLAALS